MATRQRRVRPWGHDALERRGYHKCPHCWRHLVKIEQHIEAHRVGRIGPDGRRRDRAPGERLVVRQRWVPRGALDRVAGLSPDATLLREIDEAVDQDA